MKSCHGGHGKDTVETMISTNVIILAQIHHLPPPICHKLYAFHYPPACQILPTICHPPYSSHYLASTTQQFSGLSIQETKWKHKVKWDCECLPSGECTWECLVSLLESYSQAGRMVSSCANGSVLPSVLKSLHKSILRTCIGAHSQAGWEYAILCIWEHPWEYSWQCIWMHLKSILGSTQSSRLGVSSSVIGSVLENMLRSVL